MDVVYTKPNSCRRKLSKTRPALSTPIKLSDAGVGLGVSLGTGLSVIRVGWAGSGSLYQQSVQLWRLSHTIVRQ